MIADAARLMRQMDDVLSDSEMAPRPKLRMLFDLAHQVWQAVYPGFQETSENRWPEVDAALGSEPLRHNDKINDLLGSMASGAVPQWCFDWLRESSK